MFVNDAVSNLPSISDLTFNRIHKNYLKVILWNVLFVFSIILTVLFFINYFNFFKVITPYFYLIYFLFIVAFIFVILFKFIGFKKRKYAIRDRDITYINGVLVKTTTTVPFSRIQHIEVDEGLLSRYFKLASLSLFTAGDSSDDLEIKGITKKEALEIKEFISQKINE